MIFERKKDIVINLNNGGFTNFDIDTINNQNYWLKYLNDNISYDKYYEKIIYYLETNPDYLDFDINNKDTMEFYMTKIYIETNNKKIPIPSKDNKYYNKLFGFEYIGVKYYDYNSLESEC